MAYKVAYSDRFQKHYKALHPNEQKWVKKKVTMLAENPSHPSLRVKKIQGAGHLFECSVNMDIRLIWSFEGIQLILILDVGHHDILNQF